MFGLLSVIPTTRVETTLAGVAKTTRPKYSCTFITDRTVHANSVADRRTPVFALAPPPHREASPEGAGDCTASDRNLAAPAGPEVRQDECETMSRD
jgi:hypothetical protein